MPAGASGKRIGLVGSGGRDDVVAPEQRACGDRAVENPVKADVGERHARTRATRDVAVPAPEPHLLDAFAAHFHQPIAERSAVDGHRMPAGQHVRYGRRRRSRQSVRSKRVPQSQVGDGDRGFVAAVEFGGQMLDPRPVAWAPPSPGEAVGRHEEVDQIVPARRQYADGAQQARQGLCAVASAARAEHQDAVIGFEVPDHECVGLAHRGAGVRRARHAVWPAAVYPCGTSRFGARTRRAAGTAPPRSCRRRRQDDEATGQSTARRSSQHDPREGFEPLRRIQCRKQTSQCPANCTSDPESCDGFFPVQAELLRNQSRPWPVATSVTTPVTVAARPRRHRVRRGPRSTSVWCRPARRRQPPSRPVRRD